jgi:cytochrome oxidase assembly protein ShyY1
MLVLVLIAASIMARLGQWQLDRARQNGAEQQRHEQARTPLQLVSVMQARQTFPDKLGGRPVTVNGTWDAAHQLLVADRRQVTTGGGDTAGAHGLWVLTPLRLTDGSAVPVVRGWVAQAGDPVAATSAVPTGTVQVSGILMPSEQPDENAKLTDPGPPAGQISQVDVTQLIKVWPYPLYTGFLLLSAQDPAPTGVPTQLVALQAGDSNLALQNLSYAVQWFLFAGFGCYLWWRLVREDHRGTLGKGKGPGTKSSGPPKPGGGDPADSTDPARDPTRDPARDPARSTAEQVGDDEAPTPAVGGTHP